MNRETRPERTALSLDVLEQIDRICNRFEATWEAGQRPRLEDYLGQVAEPYQPDLLCDLLAAELGARRRRGERPEPHEYRDRFPGETAVVMAAFASPPISPARSDAGKTQAACTEVTAACRAPGIGPDSVGATCVDEADPGRTEGGATGEGDTLSAPGDPKAPTVGGTGDSPGAKGTIPAIPGYEALSELGRGGMGVVYQARQVRLKRTVALKMILAGPHAGAEAAARFLAEAEAIAKLQHPNIVQIFHIDELAGFPYFEMEFVGGGSLATQLDGTPRSPREAAALVEILAGAMAEAHQRGIVHRDLKPGNILLTPEGVPKVADFGLAKLLNTDSGLTRTDSIMGSPSYMAPEQAEGKNKGIGPATDIYALGAILYELLTGRPPFRGATVLETLQQVKTAEPVPPSRPVPGLPRDLETIALKCLQKDPSRRYESATALAEDLGRYRAGEPILARPVGSAERAWRWCRRNPMSAGLLVAVATLLVAVAGSALAVARSAKVAANQYRLIAQQEERLRNETEDRAEVEAKARTELETHLYDHRIALAHREVSADNLGRAQQLLEECGPNLRQWEWYYLKRLCRVEPKILRGNRKGIYSVAFSPDGRSLAVANEDGTIGLLDVQTGAELLTLPGHTQRAFSVAYHPDGKHLASAGADRTVRVWDLTTRREVFRRDGHAETAAANDVAFSPDGRLLAAGAEGGIMTLWDAADGRKLHDLPGHKRPASSVAFSPDGRVLASASSVGDLLIWDTATGRLLKTLQGSPIVGVAFHPDGRSVATASYGRVVQVWDVSTGERRTMSGHTGIVTGVAFSPDGRRLASIGGEDKMVKLWDVDTRREVLNLRGHDYFCRCVAFSRDGERLASADMDGTVRIWDATPLRGDEGQESWTGRHDGDVWSVAFSPDGRRIASGGWDLTVRLWDASSGVPLGILKQPGVVFRIAFRPPDGRYLAASTGRAGTNTDVIKVWDVAAERGVLEARAARPYIVAFSPDGRYLLKEGADHAATVLDADTGRELGILGRHSEEIWAMTFSTDGRRLASASNDGTVKVWNATRLGPSPEEPIVTLRPRGFYGFGERVQFTPDGRGLVTAGEERTVKIWELATGRVLYTLPGHTGDVLCVAVSRDGRWIASAGEDTTVRLWDASSFKPLLKLRGHTGLVSSLAFSPDGKLLVSGSRDHTLKVWDLRRFDELRRSDR